MEVLARVFTLGWWAIQNHHGINYRNVGLDFVGSGGQGGAFNAAGKVWESNLICWSGHGCGSFSFVPLVVCVVLALGCLCGMEK